MTTSQDFNLWSDTAKGLEAYANAVSKPTDMAYAAMTDLTDTLIKSPVSRDVRVQANEAISDSRAALAEVEDTTELAMVLVGILDLALGFYSLPLSGNDKDVLALVSDRVAAGKAANLTASAYNRFCNGDSLQTAVRSIGVLALVNLPATDDTSLYNSSLLEGVALFVRKTEKWVVR